MSTQQLGYGGVPVKIVPRNRMRFREAHYRLGCLLLDHGISLSGDAKVDLIRLIQGKYEPAPRTWCRRNLGVIL